MPDDPNIPPNPSDEASSDIPEIAPSTIFVELMRQAAAKRSPQPPPPNPQPIVTPAPPVINKPAPKQVTPAPPAPVPDIPTSSDVPTSLAPDAPVYSDVPRRPRRERLRLDPNAEPLASQQPPNHESSRTQDAPPASHFDDFEIRQDYREVLNVAADAKANQTIAEQDENNEKMEAQRIQRVKRRQEKVRRRQAGVIGGFLRTTIILFLAGGLVSTIFTWFTAPEFLDRKVVSGLVIAESTLNVTLQPTILPTPNYLRKIGIVSGHRGPQNDPGAVCPDGLTEAEINFAVATQVVRNLRSLGYSVDLLDEFDERLNNYQAAALVSIHANTCSDFGERVSGFLVAKAAVRPDGGIDALLAECVAQKYGELINLERRFNLTIDMTDYHTFREIHPLTPASIIELGFMKDDREILTTRQDDMATAITNGVLCFLQPDPLNPNALFTTPSFFEGTATPTVVP